MIVVGVSKIFNRSTAFFPTIVAIGSTMELGSWLYYLTNVLKDTELARNVPLVLVSTGLGVWVVLDIGFYVVMGVKGKKDDYFKLWINTTQCNYWSYLIIFHLSLLVSFRFYRILYGRLFDLQSLSMMFKNSKIVFTISTIFGILVIVLSEVLVAVSAIQVVYYKNLKDQLFYGATETLVLTACMALLTLLDIHKTDDYFNES